MDKNGFFANFSDDELIMLSNASTQAKLDAGTTIFSEGDIGNEVFIIESGNVCIFLDKSGAQETIANLGAGEFFGGKAIFNHDIRGASAKVLSETVLWSVKKEDFIQLTQDQPVLAAKLALILNASKKEQVVTAAGVRLYAYSSI